MSATGRGRKREDKDFYPTPLASFEPLLPYLPKDVEIFEPCQGDGRLVTSMRNYGLRASGNDLATGYDALRDLEERACVVTNPPFSLASPMVQHFTFFNEETFLLLPLNFLGSGKRKEWFQDNEPALFVLADRPSFVVACRCEDRKVNASGDKGCGHKWAIAVEDERPIFCPECGHTTITFTTSDMCNYAWFYWGPRFNRIIHL